MAPKRGLDPAQAATDKSEIFPRLPRLHPSARMTDFPALQIRVCAGPVSLEVSWQLIASVLEALGSTTSKT